MASRGAPGRPRRRREGRRTAPNETARRVITALPWIAFAIFIVAVGELVFAAALIFLGVVALHELYGMMRRAGPVVPGGFLALAALVLAAHFGDSFQIVLVAAAAFPVMYAFAALRPDRRNVSYGMAVTVFGVAWVGIPLTHAVLLRDLDPHGAALLVDVLVGTFIADTSAYFAGRLFGTRRIAPSISPNKTLEGLIGGFAGGTLAFWFASLYQDWFTGWDPILMGACVAAAAPLGDLFESLVKRDLGAKDTGRLFGVHGGVLDRLDAVFFTIVVGYYLAIALGF